MRCAHIYSLLMCWYIGLQLEYGRQMCSGRCEVVGRCVVISGCVSGMADV